MTADADISEEKAAEALAWAEEITGAECSREERALERLQGWLKRPLWSGARNPVGPLNWPEGVCIIAGLDPEWSADSDVRGWSFLPGGLAFYGFDTFPRKWHGLTELRANVEENIGLLLGLGLKTAPPNRWTARVRNKKIVIPWQDARLRAAQSKRRRTQHQTDDAVVLLNGVGRTTFDAAKASGFAGLCFKTGRPNKTKIADGLMTAMRKFVGEDAPEGEVLESGTVRKRVAEWLDEGND